MSEIKFLHIGDVHLEYPFSFLPRSLADEKRNYLFKGLKEAFKFARQKRVDYVIFTGDLFHYPQPSSWIIEEVRKEMLSLREQGIKIVGIPGERDYFVQNGFWTRENLPFTYFFDSYRYDLWELPEEDLSFVGLALDHKRKEEGRLLDFNFKLKTGRSILLYYGQNQIGNELKQDLIAPFDRNDVGKLPFNYVALGGRHKMNDVYSLPNKKAYYAGTLEGLNWEDEELGKRYVLLGTISDSGEVEIIPREINFFEMVKIQFQASRGIAALRKELISRAHSYTLIQVVLEDFPDKDFILGLHDFYQKMKNNFLFLKFKDQMKFPMDLPLHEDTYWGMFVQKVMKKVEDGGDKTFYKKVIQEGLKAFYSGEDS